MFGIGLGISRGAVAKVSTLTIHQNYLFDSGSTMAQVAAKGPAVTYTGNGGTSMIWDENRILVSTINNQPRFVHAEPTAAILNSQLQAGFETDIDGFSDAFSDSGGVGDRHADAALHGGFGGRITTPAVDGEQAQLTNTSFSQPPGLVETGLWFYIVGANDMAFEVATEGWTGSRRHLTSFRYADIDAFDKWQYWNAATDNWSAVSGTGTLTRDAWHHIRAVIDWEILEYIELVVDGTHYDMTGIPIEDVANAASPFMQVALLAWTHTSNALVVYVDDVSLKYPLVNPSRGLLVEKAATNVCLNSEDIAAWTEVSTATVVDNLAISPDGDITAEEVTYGTDEWNRRYQVNTIADNVDVIASGFGRSVDGDEIFRLGSKDTVSGEQKSANFTCLTHWKRFNWTFQYGESSTAQEFAFNNNVAGTATNPILFGGQLELGDIVTSYIPTTSGSVARTADVLSADISSELGVNNTLSISARTGFGLGVLCQIDDGTENERYRIERNSSDEIRVIVTDGGVEQANLNLGVVADDTDFKVAVRFAASDFAASLDGAAVVVDTGGTLPTIDTLRPGMDTSGNEWNSTIASIQLWNGSKNNANLVSEAMP